MKKITCPKCGHQIEEPKKRTLDIDDLTDDEYKELAIYLDYIRKKRTMDFSFLED